MEDNFLTQLVRELTREGALLDLLFANSEFWVMWWLEAVLGTMIMK